MRVYASLPLTHPAAIDVLRGAQLALEARGGAELVALDASGRDRDEAARENARRAAADPDALAYLGDFHSSQVWTTAPVLGEAGLLQVAPVATFAGLHGPTLVRLMPDDGALARGIASWLRKNHVRRVLIVHDHDDGYGVPVGAMCTDAARQADIDTTARPIWDREEEMALDGAQAVLYVGVAGSGAIGLWHGLHAMDPELWLLGTDGVAAPWLAEALTPEAARRSFFFTAQRAPWGFYGYEAMALILDAIEAGGGHREATVRAARATRERDSLLGRYSLDDEGLTTAEADGRWAVVRGTLIWAHP